MTNPDIDRLKKVGANIEIDVDGDGKTDMDLEVKDGKLTKLEFTNTLKFVAIGIGSIVGFVSIAFVVLKLIGVL